MLRDAQIYPRDAQSQRAESVHCHKILGYIFHYPIIQTMLNTELDSRVVSMSQFAKQNSWYVSPLQLISFDLQNVVLLS